MYNIHLNGVINNNLFLQLPYKYPDNLSEIDILKSDND